MLRLKALRIDLGEARKHDHQYRLLLCEQDLGMNRISKLIMH
jgi:hypothetical protein